MKTYKVKVSDIHYDITEEDLDIDFDDYEDDEDYEDAVDAEIVKIRKELPNEMIVEVDCEKEDVEEEAINAVTDETGWLIEYADIKILEVK